jgi:hypothetical protein
MAQEQPATQELKRPWYYSTWFLAATFILGWPVLQFILLAPVPLLWPVWSILILRSPWHRNFLTGTVAWAMLMSGGFLVITQFSTGEMNPFFTAVIVSPGLLLAAITQFFWKRDRQKFDPTGNAIEEETGEERRPSRIRAPRQVRRQRKRGSRPGRSSRHPF